MPTDKKKFRSKKLDYNRLLAVYRYHEITDVSEAELSSRSIPVIATGVDKEEEEEHHLQAAISSSNANAKVSFIPTPDANKKVENIYPFDFEQRESFLRWSSVGDDVLEQSQKYYYLSESDVEWLENNNIDLTEDKFEEIINQFEVIAGNDTDYSNGPSELGVQSNAFVLTRYASICR